jgi:hypothetical protein
MTGQGGEGEWGDEALGAGGHGGLDVEASALELAGEFGGFVGGDASGDAKKNLHRYGGLSVSSGRDAGLSTPLRFGRDENPKAEASMG